MPSQRLNFTNHVFYQIDHKVTCQTSIRSQVLILHILSPISDGKEINKSGGTNETRPNHLKTFNKFLMQIHSVETSESHFPLTLQAANNQLDPSAR